MRASIIFLVMIVLVMAVKICIIALADAIMGIKGENVMDAVKFFKERQRMCDTYAGDCFGCPLSGEPCGFRDADAERVVGAVEKWSAAHPRKTRQDVFLEQYPNAIVNAKGTVEIWPCAVEKNMQNVRYCNSLSCADCRREFWTKEVE